ncbi:unnamed protein product [Phytophthora fragariaefolia]|uniref:Unnamed protein product n=1 Tax=Phytophthora fragariaefolia TaxID=1490495 RepID=A0A9W7D6N6_9STRA|nr:unnamed protein product [Phytophthora fragariaefolia]
MSLERKQLQLQPTLVEAPEPRAGGIRTAFRLVTFAESEEESDYEPSEEEQPPASEEEEEEEEEEGEEEEKLFESYTHQEQSEEEVELDWDARWWDSSEDKRRWEKHYRQADAAFRKRFGCAIDTPAQPEVRRKLRREKSRHRAYKLVLAGLVVAYLVQLAVVYSASSWAFSMVAWQPSTSEEMGDAPVDTSEEETVEDTPVSARPVSLLDHQVPEHVRTGLHLCATLSRRVVKSEHDVTATQHALRACDIAVKFAPLKSREGIEAHVLRGDLRSLLSRFDGADEDYKDALTLLLEVESSSIDSKLAPALSQELDLKLVANRWTQMYKTKSFKELRREVKTRAADDNDVNAIGGLAADWLSAFKQKKPVLEVLTLQRSWTLRRLKYEARDDEDDTNPM